MKHRKWFAIVIVLFVLLLGTLAFYQLGENESAVVLRFGRIIAVNVKTPSPGPTPSAPAWPATAASATSGSLMAPDCTCAFRSLTRSASTATCC